MRRLPLRTVPLFLVALLLGTGCTSKKQYFPKIQLTEGDTYALIIEKTDVTTLTVNANKLRESLETYRFYGIVVKESYPDGGARLNVTYKSCRMGFSISVRNREVPILKNQKGKSLHEEIARLSEGHTFSIDLTADGSILSVEGLDDLQKKIQNEINMADFSGVAIWNAEQTKKLSDRFFSMQTPDYLELIFGEILSVLPSRPISVGDTWNVPRLENSFGGMYYDRTVTASTVEGNKLHARLSATMESHATAEIQVDGQATSVLTIDLNTGLVTMQVLTETLTGTSVSEGFNDMRGTVTTTIEILKM
jgi:hypothetical protein